MYSSFFEVSGIEHNGKMLQLSIPCAYWDSWGGVVRTVAGNIAHGKFVKVRATGKVFVVVIAAKQSLARWDH